MKKSQNSPFEKSLWIWPDEVNWDLHNGYALFRKPFDLVEVPSSAPLFITADQSYRLYVNGHYVGRGPARGFQESWPYDEIDIAAHLRPGLNMLAIRAYNPGFSNFQYLSEGFAGLLVAAQWGKTIVSSDASWKALRQPGINRGAAPSSMQLFPQEHIDLRLSPHDWVAPGFDDSGWARPATRPWNSAPWYSLEPRGIPLLAEKEVPSPILLGRGEGACAEGYVQARDIVALRQKETRNHKVATAKTTLLNVERTGTGQFRSYLFDFGKLMVGSLIFEIQGALGGEIIDTHLTETIDSETLTPDQVIPTHCRMAFGDRVITRPGSYAHRFFHHYGFRYLMVTVRDAAHDFRLGVKLNWIGYPLERKGSFSSSDVLLEKIWETCAWTQQCCALDAYVDTPWREQAQWWGDARVQGLNTFHLSGDARLFRRGISQIARQTTPDGVTYGHSPTMAHECVLPDFTLIWLLTLWDYYWQTGSTEAFKAHQKTIDNALAYFRSKTDPKTGLIVYDYRYWLFLDWTNLFKDGASSVYNLLLVLALEKMALLHRKTQNPERAVELEQWARKVRSALGKLVGKDGLLRDGLDWKRKIVSETSIHSQTLALIIGLSEIDETAAMKNILLPFIRGETRPKAFPSAYWVTYLFQVLISRGKEAEVLAFIAKHWAPMVEHGTTWENFSPLRASESRSHAWSAHPIYHFMQTMGGIYQAAPAWKQIVFRPFFHGDHNRTVVPTPQGDIVSEWNRSENGLQVKLKLPAGVRARVELPGQKAQILSGDGQWTLKK